MKKWRENLWMLLHGSGLVLQIGFLKLLTMEMDGHA